MKKIYLGIIIVFTLTLIGCGAKTINQRHDTLDNSSYGLTNSPTPTSTPTLTPSVNVVPPDEGTFYTDENHKIIKFGKLSLNFDLGNYHIVSEIFDGRDYTIGYMEDQSSSSNSSPDENMIIREMKNLKLMDKESIQSYLIKMIPNYENIRIYNYIIDDSGIMNISVITGCDKTYCIVNYSDTSYLIETNLKTIEWYIISSVFITANYEEVKQNIECANSYFASINEIIDREADTVKYGIIQGKNNEKYTAELNLSGDEYGRYNFTLKKDNGEIMLNIDLGAGEPNEVITFIDVNLDGYVDIQVLDQPGAMNNSYNFYVWDEIGNNYVKVKSDSRISYFEVNEGCIVTWERGGYDSGNQKFLIWIDNKTLVTKSEEEYHADDSSVSDKHIDFLVENELKVFEDQSFSIDLENFGDIRFVSGEIELDNWVELRLYLTDNNGYIIYLFPDFYGNRYPILTGLSAVAFEDVNKDGSKDIIIIAYYMTGFGEYGAEEFPVAGIYFQREKEFINISEIDEQINVEGKNKTIDEVTKFTETIDFSRFN